MRALNDLDSGRQQQDVIDVDMLQLLAERHDLGLGRVQLQSAGSHPLADVLHADCEAVNGCLYLADLTRSYKLGCRQRTGGCADHDARSTVQAHQSAEGTAAAPGWNPAEHQTEATAYWIADHCVLLRPIGQVRPNPPQHYRPTCQDRSEVVAVGCHGGHYRMPPTDQEGQAR